MKLSLFIYPKCYRLAFHCHGVVHVLFPPGVEVLKVKVEGQIPPTSSLNSLNLIQLSKYEEKGEKKGVKTRIELKGVKNSEKEKKGKREKKEKRVKKREEKNRKKRKGRKRDKGKTY